MATTGSSSALAAPCSSAQASSTTRSWSSPTRSESSWASSASAVITGVQVSRRIVQWYQRSFTRLRHSCSASAVGSSAAARQALRPWPYTRRRPRSTASKPSRSSGHVATRARASSSISIAAPEAWPRVPAAVRILCASSACRRSPAAFSDSSPGWRSSSAPSVASITSASRPPASSRPASRKRALSRRKVLSPSSPRTSRSSARSFFMSFRASCTASSGVLSDLPRSSSSAWSIRPRAMRATPSGNASSSLSRYLRDTATSLSLALEQPGRGAGRVEPSRHYLVEQLLHRLVVADLGFEPAAQPRPREGQHLVHQVAAAPLGEGALLADEGVVLLDLLGHLLDPLAAARLRLHDRHAPALLRTEREDDRVGVVDDVDLGLAHPDRLQEHVVLAARVHQERGLERGLGQTPERAPARHRADEHAGVEEVVREADPVAQQGALGEG